MAIENAKVIESIVIDEDDLRVAELAQELNPDCDFVQDKHGQWYVRGTGELDEFEVIRICRASINEYVMAYIDDGVTKIKARGGAFNDGSKT